VSTIFNYQGGTYAATAMHPAIFVRSKFTEDSISVASLSIILLK